jgi:hypothetical protein
MQDKERSGAAVSERKAVVSDHGSIDSMSLLEGFEVMPLSAEEMENEYFEYKVPGTTARICYEQSEMGLSELDCEALKALFDEVLSEKNPSRQLDFSYDANGVASNEADSNAYFAICQSFVFGGYIVRGGCRLDEDRSTWETHRVGADASARTVIVGNLRFMSPDGKPHKNRQVCVVMPIVPGPGGCGYVWLEGTGKEVERYRQQFLQVVVGEGRFRELPGSII